MLKEKSVPAKASKTQLVWGTSAGRPTPHEMGLRLVCVKKLVTTRPSQEGRRALRATDGKRCRGIFFFFKAGWKRFFFYDMGDGISL